MAKSLGTGFRKNLNFKDIEILNDKIGKPYYFRSKKIDNWISNFKDSEQIIQDEDLYSFLSSPQVPTSEKLNSIDTLMKGYEGLFVNFLKVLVTRGQVELFDDIKEEFLDQNKILLGKVSASVTSSVKLSDNQKKLLKEKICEIFDVTDVDIKEHNDESIIGGFIIKVGDTIIDSSTQNKLNGLEKHLLRSTTLK